MSFPWPDNLTQVRCNPELRNFTASGGRTGTGREQRVYRDAGFWEIRYGEFRINSDETILSYRAMIARLRQGEEIIARVTDLAICKGQEPIRVTADAGLRATSVMIGGVAADLKPGHHISIDDRLYRVTQINSQVEALIGLVVGIQTGQVWQDADFWEDLSDIASSVSFLPPLRAPVAENTLVEFDDLTCTCVLKDMSDGDLDLEYGRYGGPSFTLIESI